MSVADQQPDEGDVPRATEPAGGAGLAVRSSTEGAVTVLTVDGEVDMRTAPVLADEVGRHFDADDRGPLVFDLSGVDFFGSAGLAILANAQARATEQGTTVWVVAPSRTVSRSLEITGVDALLNVVHDLPTALRAAR